MRATTRKIFRTRIGNANSPHAGDGLTRRRRPRTTGSGTGQPFERLRSTDENVWNWPAMAGLRSIAGDPDMTLKTPRPVVEIVHETGHAVSCPHSRCGLQVALHSSVDIRTALFKLIAAIIEWCGVLQATCANGFKSIWYSRRR